MPVRTTAEIARQTLQLLANRRQPPTPQNYQAVFEEVAGQDPYEAFPQRRLRHIASLMPSQTAGQKLLSAQLHQAIEGKDWQQLQATLVQYAHQAGQTAPLLTPHPALQAPEVAQVLPSDLAEQLARLIENTVSALGAEDQRTQDISLQLVDFLRHAPPPLHTLTQMLGNYSLRLSFLSQEQGLRTHSTQQLLAMAVQHLCAIASEDPPLLAQAQKVTEAMQPAWDVSQLEEIQRQLKSLLFRHFELHTSQQEAYERIKDLLAQYAGHMAQLSSNSQQHQEQLSGCAQQIQSSQHLGQLAPLLQNVVDSGGRLARESHHAMTALQDLRDQAEAQEAQIHQLSAALQRMQDTSRHDPMTAALNTQGFEEALLAEAERSQRQGSAWSVAVLHAHLHPQDKERLGLDVHDYSLRHLTYTARSCLRPQDLVARTSEQHLVLLLPHSNAQQSAQALARLQHELAQRPLLYGDYLIPIDISAGLVQALPADPPKATLERAAQALLQALRMGGQRVVLA
ncbi:MAG: GGDEF domain-containing protein [Comamonas sp.]|nr:GGDEF domain-containing protein [Comamonas sp.]